jgi:hypothetical protein
VAFARKAADEIRTKNILKSFGLRKISELVVTTYKFTNNFLVLVTSGLQPDVTRRPPA